MDEQQWKICLLQYCVNARGVGGIELHVNVSVTIEDRMQERRSKTKYTWGKQLYKIKQETKQNWKITQDQNTKYTAAEQEQEATVHDSSFFPTDSFFFPAHQPNSDAAHRDCSWTSWLAIQTLHVATD